MATRLTITEASKTLADVVDRVRRGERAEIVDADGNAVAVVMNIDDFRRYEESAPRDFFDIVAQIHERNRDADPDEVVRDVTAVVEEVRQARYDRGR